MESIVCRRCGAEYTHQEFIETHSEDALDAALRGVIVVNCAKCPTHELSKARPTA